MCSIPELHILRSALEFILWRPNGSVPRGAHREQEQSGSAKALKRQCSAVRHVVGPVAVTPYRVVGPQQLHEASQSSVLFNCDATVSRCNSTEAQMLVHEVITE